MASSRPEPQPPREVQRAHDILLAIVTKQVDLPMTEEAMVNTHIELDVLCWLMGHNHNQAFGDKLVTIRQTLRRLGVAESDLV